MKTHIITFYNYVEWNTFHTKELVAICGYAEQRVTGPALSVGSSGGIKWSHTPQEVLKEDTCPDCLDHPDYALMLLADV